MSDWDARTSDGSLNLELCPRELQVLDRLLRAVRTASYLLCNEAREGQGDEARWLSRNRWAIVQAVAQAYLELGPALFDVTTTWFDGNTPKRDGDDRFSRFTNYWADGQVFHGSVLYDDREKSK